MEAGLTTCFIPTHILLPTDFQIDFGYSKKGLGINTSLRRLENFNIYGDKLAEGNIYNQKTLSYVPALTKQQDYLLTNIYVYNSQPRLVVNNLEKRVGEIGFQNDIFYTFKKESIFGKYKTKIIEISLTPPALL